MIEVKNLIKSYQDVTALDGISFKLEEGEIFGLLGPNGAGKTTTISIISGLLSADSGSVSVAGMDVASRGREVRRLMGVVPQEIAIYQELSARENLHFWGSLYGLSGSELRESADRVLDMVGLAERADHRVETYSGGMKRRINLCIGLIHQPRIVMLDEPTLGIDPQARLNILDIVKNEVSRGTTVLYTTHYLEEAENLCDRIAIIDKGEILAEGTLRDLTRLVGEEDMITIQGDFKAGQVGSLPRGIHMEHLDDGLVRVRTGDSRAIGPLLQDFMSAGLRVEDVSIREPSLESVFIKLTGRELRD